MRRCYRFSTVIMILGVLCLFLIPSVCPAQQKAITLNYADYFPATHKQALLVDQWCKEVEKRTNGRVKVTPFHGSTLTPAPMIYDSVTKGIADIGMGTLGYTRGRFPLSEFTDHPLGYPNSRVATKLFNEYYKKFKPKEFDDAKVLYLQGIGPALLHTAKKPVAKLEDLKGLKIRASGLQVAPTKALGASPVGMPISDVYDALSKNVADGGFFPYEALDGWKLGEVIKYTTESYPTAMSSGLFVVMNKKRWESLPADIQKIITQFNEEWVDKVAKTWDDIDKEGKDFSLKRGNKTITLSKEEGERWRKAVQPVLDSYVKTTRDQGLPGDAVLKFAQDFLKKNPK
jgi:TRAP-type transport system periplasmic protein